MNLACTDCHAVLELIKYKQIIDNGGVFKLFSSEWRNAKKSVLKLSSKQKPDKKKLLSYLADLIAYTQGIEEIDKLNNQDSMLNELYRGIDTPIDRLIALREWYQLVRNEYGVGFGDRVSIANALLALDRNLAISIVDVAGHGLLEEVDLAVTTLRNTTAKYTELQSIKNHQVQLFGDNSPVTYLHESLESNIKMLSNVVIGSNLTINDIKTANNLLEKVHKGISVWIESGVTQHFVPRVLPLSIKYGEYSKKNYAAAKNTLDITTVRGKLRQPVVTQCNTRKNLSRCLLPT